MMEEQCNDLLWGHSFHYAPTCGWYSRCMGDTLRGAGRSRLDFHGTSVPLRVQGMGHYGSPYPAVGGHVST
jgi:hypothetical protein